MTSLAAGTRAVTIHTETQPYAVVNVVDGRDGILLPYQASIFAMHARLRETGVVPKHADHVLLQCGNAKTHPRVRIIRFDCDEIDEVVSGKDFHRHIFYRIAGFKLVDYKKVLLIDFDAYISADISGAFDYPAPAMVRWESPVAGPFQPNGGVTLVAPSAAMYKAALSWLRKLPKGTVSQRRAKIFEMRSPWGAFGNRSQATAPDPSSVLAADSDQQYFFMFWNVLERERFGPLHELPFEYNVKHYVLSQKQWTARAYLVFMSRPEQGHIRIVHFNRDKPWAGAQCGPFQHAFWHAASRAISGLSSSDASQLTIGGEHGLAAFVREGMRHEDARPCIAGARSASVFVPTLSLERQGFVGGPPLNSRKNKKGEGDHGGARGKATAKGIRLRHKSLRETS